MSPALRTTWAMLNWHTLGVIALLCLVLTRLPSDDDLTRIALNALSWAGLAVFGAHVARMLEVGVWRVLPAGRRTAIRALGIIVVALSLLFGALFRWAAPDVFGNLPLGMTLLLFIHLSLYSFLLLLGMGRQLPRLFVLVYLVATMVSLIVTSIMFRDSPGFWIGGTAACAAAWIGASMSSLRAPAYSRRRFAWASGFENLLALADRSLTTGGSPARTLLRSGRTGGANLIIAMLVVASIAAFQGFLLGRLPLPNPRLLLSAPLTFAGFFAMFLAYQYARPAKQLWLRWANSRAELFRFVERMVIGDVCIVAGAACVVAMGIAIHRGYDLTLVVALKMVVAGFGIAISLAYVSLFFAALRSLWTQTLVAMLGAVGVLYGTRLWLVAFGGSAADGAGFLVPELVTAVVALVALRHLAFASWRRMDWSHHRSAKK